MASKSNVDAAFRQTGEPDSTSPVVSQRRGNGGSGDATIGPGTGTEARDASSGSADSDGPEFDGHGNAGAAGAADNVDGNDDFGLPLGDVQAIRQGDPTRKRARRARTGKRSGGGSGAGTDQNAGRSTAEEIASSDSDVLPREVSLDSLGKNRKVTPKDSALSLEFFTESWGLLFHGLSVAFKDAEWKLPTEDAAELAERTQKWMRSGGSRRMKSIEQAVAKYQPSLSLIMGLSAVIVPRISHTREKRALATKAKQAAAPRAGSVAGSTPATSATNGVVELHPSGSRVNGTGPVHASEHSVRREDFHRFFGEDDGPAS